MPATINYIVQSFHKQGRKLVSDQARKMQSAEAAIDGAKRLVERKAGVVAYSIGYDAEADMTEDPKILFKAGELPREMTDE